MIDRVITSLQDPDNMEKINEITGLDLFDTDNWCDLDQFLETPKLQDFVEQEKFEALKNKKADYIAFRLDY